MKYKNIIFDFDGVLIDSIEWIFNLQNKTLEKINKQDFKEYFKSNPIKKFNDYNENKVKTYLKDWAIFLKDKTISDEARNFLNKNHDKKIFIITSNEKENVKNILKNSNAEKYFLEVLGKDEHHSKVEKFKMLQEKYNLDFEETIFITDSSGDLKEANHFPKLTTLGATFGIHCKETLEEENPNFICNSWEEIEKIIL